ncbi:hypothetical protein [Microvirga roseola]|uniref:hypothetical protein n=1 Tax=Microvirga roseola TaxID=2883126 RepID=UPI001E384627|nr:hypothetical protein [Microvirga roseola]
MTILVDAAHAHPYSVHVTLPTEISSRFLAELSGILDESDLVRGEDWSLAAEVRNGNVHLTFGLSSQVYAGLLKSAIDHLANRDSSGEPSLRPLSVVSSGPASHRRGGRR